MSVDEQGAAVLRGDQALADDRPGALSRGLHWALALLIVFQGVLGAANLRVHWLHAHAAASVAVHQDVGLLILLLTLWMLALRAFEGRRSGLGLPGLQAKLAGWMHAGLYALIVGEALLGLWLVGLRGKGLTLIVWHVPLPVRPDPQIIFHGAMQFHALLALSLAALIVGHALAALYHHFVLRDSVLRRMLP